MSEPKWYELYWHVAEYSLPMLKALQENAHGYPAEFHEDHEGDSDAAAADWNNTIGAMIEAFELIGEDDWQFDEDARARVEQGVALFGKHFLNLWD